MQAAHINVFIESLENLFSTVFSAEASRGALKLSNGAVSEGDFTFVIKISGMDKEHFIITAVPTATAAKAGSEMLGMDMPEDSPDLADVMSEIGNMLVGNSKPGLKEVAGATVDINLSGVQKGSPAGISSPKWIEVPFTSSIGPFKMLATV